MRPYKTRDDGVDGVLMALVDVDALKSQLRHSEESLEKSEELAEKVADRLWVPKTVTAHRNSSHRFCSQHAGRRLAHESKGVRESRYPVVLSQW
jgi:hypothetical protein